MRKGVWKIRIPKTLVDVYANDRLVMDILRKNPRITAWKKIKAGDLRRKK